MLTVNRYDFSMKGEWNSFLQTSKNSTFLFDRNFMEYHSDRFVDYSLVIKDDSRVIALLPANINAQNIVISHAGLTYGGLVVNKKEKLLNVISYLKEIMKFLHEAGVEKLVYKEIPAIYNDVLSDELHYAFFLTGAKLVRCDTCTAIKNPYRQAYQHRRISAIKKAQQLGIEIVNDNDFDCFWKNILAPHLLQKHSVSPVHTAEEIKILHRRFPENIKQYNAYLNGEIMAGVTVFEMPNVARAQYTSGSCEGRKNGALDFLFHKLISEVYADKEYFDFGNSNENESLVLNRGLIEWKEGLGGRTYTQNFYKVNTANYPSLDAIINSGSVSSSEVFVGDEDE